MIDSIKHFISSSTAVLEDWLPQMILIAMGISGVEAMAMATGKGYGVSLIFFLFQVLMLIGFFTVAIIGTVVAVRGIRKIFSKRRR